MCFRGFRLEVSFWVDALDGVIGWSPWNFSFGGFEQTRETFKSVSV